MAVSATHLDGATGGVVVLFALEREAAPFRRAARALRGVSIHVTGIESRAGAFVGRLLTDARPGCVVMAGFCGALRPALAVGDVVVPGDVIDPAGNRWPCPDGTPGVRLLTAPELVATPAEKRHLHELHCADIVDMESAAVAAACAERGVPFRAVRAVSDTADTALSPRLVKMLSGGNVSPWRAAAALVRQPSLLGEFLRLARDTKFAAERLGEALLEVVREKNPRAEAVRGLSGG